MAPTFFASVADFRAWMKRHHRAASELLVGFYKLGSGRPSITWPESVDEALCFGWIDGVRKSLRADSYVIRFTPRKRGSTWSTVNTRRAEALIREKRMQPAGLRAFRERDPNKSGIYSFEQRKTARLPAEAEARFKQNRSAWRFFESQPPGYRRITTWWVISAKRAETRRRRLDMLIADSAAGRRIPQLRRESQESRRPER
jgi:uncharacterized protein YdeI (YjbR/CyaY-like superfamily)